MLPRRKVSHVLARGGARLRVLGSARDSFGEWDGVGGE